MARFAQELLAGSQKRAKYRTPNSIVELEGPIASPRSMRAEIDAAVSAGLELALEDMAERVTDQAPSSRETGTRLEWSKKTASEMSNRMTLKEGVRWRTSRDEEGNLAGEVYLHADVEYIGRFVEYGHELVLWGRNTERVLEPQPFMRTAYEGGRENLTDDTAKGTREALR
jgi:hypothetical protein